MKKFITIIVAFMSVLTLWGQTDEDKDIKRYLEYFQQNKGEVILQAKQKGHLQDGDSALIISVINDAEYLYNNYANIASKNETLSSEIKTSLTTFCTQFYNDITSADKQKILIGTRSFSITIKSYQTTFESLCKKIEESLSSSSPAADGDDNSDDDNNDPDNPIHQDESSMSLLYVLIILSLIVGAASAIFAVLALKKINSTNKELKKLKTKINKIEEAAASSKSRGNQTRNRTNYPAPATAKTEPTYPSQQSVQYNNVAVTPPPAPERKENVNKTPQETYLYANTNANGGIEFYKVTTENSGDKVFMIILKKADDENGDFTIAPMSDNFMREVIANRDMFLPSTFCERIVGSPNPTRIEVDAKGKAKKVGGKWQMQERMKIRLI